MTKRSLRVLAATLLLALAAVTARASEFSDDLRARRARLMERLGPDAMLILWSAPPARYSTDIDYEYRQDSNLYYLTGVTQEGTILVLMPGNASKQEVLFVRPHDPVDEHWHGRRMSTDEAKALTGIDTVLSTDTFDTFVSTMLVGSGYGTMFNEKEVARFAEARTGGRARLALALEPNRRIGDPLSASLDFAARARQRFTGFSVVDATPWLTELRVVKTPYERKVLVRSLEISSEAQMAGMHAARPGAYEYEVKAAIEAVHRARGASSWAYPSIVGGGPNATILHYPEGSRQMQAGELLLVDAACDYASMSGDITRTYPVSGTFTPAQRDIYEVVLEAQDDAAAVAVAGGTLRAVHNKAVDTIKAGLLKLGLITDASGNQYRLWFTHGTSHYIGVDVHDVGSNDLPLTPGMAFTIEPGIYIRQAALDALPRSAENDALIAKVQAAVRKYADIGIRVEDSFLLEESGLRRLSGTVPRTMDDIERLLKSKTPAASAPSGARP